MDWEAGGREFFSPPPFFLIAFAQHVPYSNHVGATMATPPRRPRKSKHTLEITVNPQPQGRTKEQIVASIQDALNEFPSDVLENSDSITLHVLSGPHVGPRAPKKEG
jgi:hypothetical protein